MNRMFPKLHSGDDPVGAAVQANGVKLALVFVILDDGLKPTAILRPDFDSDPCSHTESMNLVVRSGNPPKGTIH